MVLETFQDHGLVAAEEGVARVGEHGFPGESLKDRRTRSGCADWTTRIFHAGRVDAVILGRPGLAGEEFKRSRIWLMQSPSPNP